jgi:hypothetical protein
MTNEKRKSYRCPVVDDNQKGVIRIGRRNVIVALANQSAGGFLVTARGNVRVRKDQLLLMRTSAGWFQARVIHKEKSGGQTTIGLIRLADLPDPRDAHVLKPGGRKFEGVGGGNSTSGNLLLVVIVAGLAFWGSLVDFAWFRGPDAAHRPIGLGAYMSHAIENAISSSPQKLSHETDHATANPTSE